MGVLHVRTHSEFRTQHSEFNEVSFGDQNPALSKQKLIS